LRKVRKGLSTALGLLGRENAELSILFVGSTMMKRLNTEYRNIPRETDVLSFPLNDIRILGDIVISVPRTVIQAKNYGTTFDEELFRLLIHGLLHLIGYDHEKNRYQSLKMKEKERELLHAIQGMD
jgi:probable rRNA maturation factor